MATLDAESMDSIITDPPYGLKFMGKAWDHGVPGVPFWEAALRIAKPGAMLMAFGGTRTVHRLACAIEDSGWEIRDRIQWLYGSGFPKSLDISKAIDKAAGAEREVVGLHAGPAKSIYSQGEGRLPEAVDITAPATEAAKLWHGYGTALKPAHEPIIVAMKPIDGTFAQNALTHGVAGLWIDGGRIPGVSQSAAGMPGFGCRDDGYDRGTGRQYQTTGRWPANIIHDGSAEVLPLFPETGNAFRTTRKRNGNPGMFGHSSDCNGHKDSGSAARFFYCAKASRSERTNGGTVDNGHPTVKPLALMEYLCKLTRTPTGGVVLDPFMGSGTTGMAAIRTGRDFIGIEKDAASFATAAKRIAATEAENPLLTALA